MPLPDHVIQKCRNAAAEALRKLDLKTMSEFDIQKAREAILTAQRADPDLKGSVSETYLAQLSVALRLDIPEPEKLDGPSLRARIAEERVRQGHPSHGALSKNPKPKRKSNAAVPKKAKSIAAPVVKARTLPPSPREGLERWIKEGAFLLAHFPEIQNILLTKQPDSSVKVDITEVVTSVKTEIFGKAA